MVDTTGGAAETSRHSHAERAQAGREAARGAGGGFRVVDDHPAAIAYRRARGAAGWGNRSARRRGFLGFDMLPVPARHARVS